MRRISISVCLILFFCAAMFAGCTESEEKADISRGQEIFEEAEAAYEEGELTRANELYDEAKTELINEGNDELAAYCETRKKDIIYVSLTYPLNEDEAKENIAAGIPQVTEDEIDKWFENEDVEFRIIDGEKMYMEECLANMLFRNVELFQMNEEMLAGYTKMYELLVQAMDDAELAKSWQPYTKPATYSGNSMLNVPRDLLPQSGLMKIWMPVPILTGPQSDVRIIEANPEEYVPYAPSIDEDIGLVYFEIPLEELDDDLDLNVKFIFTHHEQRYEIDPELIGEYDSDCELFLKYTKSEENIRITPEIEEKAKAITGSEENPYLAAKLIYDYIVNNVKYSYMPHLALGERGDPESVYVHNNKFGDCGAQSMYFSALCRSVGIPARTTGGWQLFSGNFSGHFWAEFYVPNYGWVPVDPTAADAADYMVGITDEEVKRYKDFFFANQDNYRCIVQKNVDVTFIPPAEDRTFLPMAVQSPAILFDDLDVFPIVFLEYASIEAERLQ